MDGKPCPPRKYNQPSSMNGQLGLLNWSLIEVYKAVVDVVLWPSMVRLIKEFALFPVR